VIVHVDGGDLGCARLLVLLRARACELAPGTVVHLTTTDPVAPIDLPAWCRMTGHGYLGPVPGPGDAADAGPDDAPGDAPRDGADDSRSGPRRRTYAIEVAAAPRPTDPDRPWHAAG
jgi:tRNA 2-thiouridine synthesizing protein A